MKRGIIALVILGLCLGMALPVLAADDRSEKDGETRAITWSLAAGEWVSIARGRNVKLYLGMGGQQAMAQASDGKQYMVPKGKEVTFTTTDRVKLTCTMVQPQGALLKVRTSR